MGEEEGRNEEWKWRISLRASLGMFISEPLSVLLEDFQSWNPFCF
jgi:hypothetical protein